MGGHGGADPAGVEVVQDGARQGGALGRVRATTQLVEQNQAVLTCLREHCGDIAQMAGKGAEALLNALLVADISRYVLEHGHSGVVASGDVQAGLGHEAEETDGLESDGLAPGIGAGDDEGVEVVAEAHVDGHDGRGRLARPLVQVEEQRVTGLVQADGPPVVEAWRLHVEVATEAHLGKGQVNVGQHGHGSAQGVGAAGDEGGELTQDARHLRLLIVEGGLELVAQLAHSLGLDEDRSATVGLVAAQTGDAVGVARLDGDDGSTLALANARVLQVGVHIAGAQDGLEPALDPATENLDLLANGVELGGGPVLNGGAVAEGSLDAALDLRVRVDVLVEATQVRVALVDFGEVALDAAARNHGLAGVEDLLDGEDVLSLVQSVQER